jgi:hypothetical protein
MLTRLAAHRPPATKALLTRTRRCTIGAAAVPLLLGLPGSARPAPSPDSGLAGCTALSGAHHVAAKDYPKISAQFAGSRWPDLGISGLAYVEMATKLLTTHAYGGETVWFYERLSAACAEHGRALPFWPARPVGPARGGSVRGSGRLLFTRAERTAGVVHARRSRRAERVHLDAQPAVKK